jgi:hypothetical protein
VITTSVINQSLFNLSAEGRKVKKQQTVPELANEKRWHTYLSEEATVTLPSLTPTRA